MQAPTSPWWARGMPIPTGVTERLTAPSAEFLLALPSGSLVVDGAEYYRSSQPNANDSAPRVTIPVGDYAVRWYAAKDDEATPASERELEQAIGSADLSY